MSATTDVATPALLLDPEVLERNLDAMARRMSDLGVALRPHLKTAKSAEIATRAVRGHPGGITVSTLDEAEYFAGHGFRDLTYAVGIAPDKLARVASLERHGVRVRVITDDPGVARSIAEEGRRTRTRFHVLIEIDTGGHRGGVEPDSAEVLSIARELGCGDGACLEGVLTHAGHAYECVDVPAIRAVAEQERAGVVRAAERLREAGFPCPVVSAGSTPTAVLAERLDGVTEMRPGNYMFFDLFQEGLGVCRRDDLALSVAATVIGHSPRFNRLLIDAGALALSLDTSANRFPGEPAYGIVLDAAGRSQDAGLRVVRVHQEHGFVEAPRPIPFERLPIGSRVRVLPNHACATAALFDRYHVPGGTIPKLGVGVVRAAVGSESPAVEHP